MNVLATLAVLLCWRRLSAPARLRLALGYTVCRAALFYGSMAPNCGWFSPVRSRFHTARREVWLTLDDGPDPSHTPRVLDLLDAFGARATFFLIGRRVRQEPDLARQIVQRGHQVGNHTYTHQAATFWCTLRRGLRTEIHDASEAIFSATGHRPGLFRAPAGICSPFMHSILEREALLRVGWSARGYDAGILPDQAVERIMARVRPGAIIVLHAESAPDGPSRLERLLLQLTQAGYRCVLPVM